METSPPPDLTFAARLRHHRERAGKTRAVLGGLVGKSEEWVKAVESGRLLPPRLPILLRLAQALDIRDLADLTGTQSVPVESITKAGHEAARTIADVMSQPAPPPDPAPDLPALLVRVDQAWRLWHTSAQERTAIARLLPGLLHDARATVRGLDSPDRRRASVQLARVYHLAQLFWAHQPAAENVWLAADRARAAAEDADDPQAIAVAAWYYAHVYRGSGRVDQAEQTIADALRLVDPAGEEEERVRWGMLHLAQALGAAKRGRSGDAMRHLDQAGAAAAALGGAYMHPWLLFGSATVDAYAVTIAADLCRLGEAARMVDRIDPAAIPSRTRQAAYLIEAARVHSPRRSAMAIAHLLTKAAKVSIDTTRHSPYARAATLELMEHGPVREEARELALSLGLLN